MKKILKKVPLSAFLIVPCALVFCIMIGLIMVRFQAQSMGSTLGEQTGTIVGKALGSWIGMTEGWPEGIEAAIAEENTIPDAKTEITGRFQEVGKLEVLIASGTYTQIIKVGKDATELPEGSVADVYYARYLSQKYKAIWTVDLNSVSVEEEGGILVITLDQPDLEFKRIGSPETKGEYLKYKNWNKAKNGAKVAESAFNKLTAQAETEFKNDDSMMQEAKKAATEQIEKLVNWVSFAKPRISIEFRNEEESK